MVFVVCPALAVWSHGAVGPVHRLIKPGQALPSCHAMACGYAACEDSGNLAGQGVAHAKCIGGGLRRYCQGVYVAGCTIWVALHSRCVCLLCNHPKYDECAL
jgi:hypothetical protein